jgi:DNA modification methylase
MMAEKVIIGNCELWHGDCREVLPLLPDFDLILTDPPYGIGAARKDMGKWRTYRMGKMEWDSEPPPQWLMLLMLEKAAHLIIFGGNYFNLPPSRNYLVWDKGAGFKGRDFAECEFAWCSWDGNAKVLTRDPLANRDYEHKVHPTQKPVRVLEWAMSLAPKSDTVCDPFMGSGTTGVAALNLGKRFVGVECERQYFDAACERIDRALAQPRLFEDAKVGAGGTAAQGDMFLPANAEVTGA